jgi:hypothetical protein
MFLILTGLLAIGCALNPDPLQMYEGAPLPKEQVGIIRSGCIMGNGLTIMTTQIDGKDISDFCADFALLPGEHQIEVSAKRLGPKLETGMMGSGRVMGAPPFPMSAGSEQRSEVIWSSPSTLRITCTVLAGKEVTIVGTGGVGQEWQARCQERER